MRRNRARLERRDLRRDQGHLRRHAHRSSSRPARWRLRAAGVGRARPARTAQRLAAVLSGANMNFDRLRFVAERAELGEAREALFGVTIPERPGAFRDFCAAIGRRVVTEFNYRLSGRDAGAHLRRRRDAVAAGRAIARGGVLTTRGYETVDPDRQRNREAARAAHGRRPRAGCRATSGCAASSFPNGPGALMAVPRAARRPLEHQPVPLSESRRRLRPRARRLRGAGRGHAALRGVPRRARLPLSARDWQRRIRVAPGRPYFRSPMLR